MFMSIIVRLMSVFMFCMSCHLFCVLYVFVLFCVSVCLCTGHTQNNGAVSVVFTIETAPFFCVCSVHAFFCGLCYVFIPNTLYSIDTRINDEG